MDRNRNTATLNARVTWTWFVDKRIMLQRETPILNVIIDSKYVIKKRGLQGLQGKSKIMRCDGLTQGVFVGDLSLQWNNISSPGEPCHLSTVYTLSTHLAPCSHFYKLAACVTFSRHSSKHECFCWECLHKFKPFSVFRQTWMAWQNPTIPLSRWGLVSLDSLS